MIVVDTNVIAYLWLPGALTESSIKALKKDPFWIAPTLWKSELQNILSRYLRCKHLTPDTALTIIKEAEKLMHGNEINPPSRNVIENISASNLSTYDLEFITLAQILKIPLVTSDKKLLKAFPDITTSLKTFATN